MSSVIVLLKGGTMIECTGFKKSKKNCLVGFANLFIPKMGVEIYGCSLYEKDGKRWVNLPSKECVVDGEKKFFSVIKFRDPKHKEEFTRQAKEAIDLWMKENKNAD